MSFDLILPFLRPIAHLTQDPNVGEIMVNAGGRVFQERAGVLNEAKQLHLAEKNMRVAVRNIARMLRDDVSEEQPILDARLPDGSRVSAVIPPCSRCGTTLTIRKFQSRFFTAGELVRGGTLTESVRDQIRTAIDAQQYVLISGGTSAGKTTLLNTLAAFCRLASCVLRRGVELPYVAISQQIGDAIRLVVHLERRQGVRCATAVARRKRSAATSRRRTFFTNRIRGTTMMGQPGRDDEPKKGMAAIDDPWLSVKQAAMHAGVCEKTIRRAYVSRQVQYTRVGRAVRFRRTWVDKWMFESGGPGGRVAAVDV
jgi:excisionase family DNA binding protein